MDVNQQGIKRMVAVVGAGSFGIAVTHMLAKKGIDAHLWCYLPEEAQSINETHHHPTFFTDYDLPNVSASNDMAEVVQGCESVIIVTPSFGVRNAAIALSDCLPPDIPVVVLSKGLDAQTDQTLYQAVADVLGNGQRVAVLAGPNHAEELIKGSYAGAVVASTGKACAQYFQQLLSSTSFRLYTVDDPIGVSLCAAAKNVIAIACGMARGLGQGDNTVALLMTRGAAEISRLVEAAGGRQETVFGLAGIGDLNATCCSPHSRNGAFGEAFVTRGISVADYESERSMVVEGAHAVKPLLSLARGKGIELPIMQAVDDLLDGRMSIDDAPACLMNRALKDE
ncbi:MAG: NAD(P)H-dependent glycerol-3-phosphate dehydrogenase [Eggerthellaceae bacterium]|jgi:glycerol-3-phosphate dehydrogenase (NAD(P)+)